MVRIKAELCIACKASRLLCGLSTCPKLDMIGAANTASEKVKKEFFGPAPSVFVGRIGWPNVSVGPVGALTDSKSEAQKMDSPSQWFGSSYGDLIKMRSSMVRGKHKENVYSRDRIVGDVQELAMSSRPTDTEIVFKKAPSRYVSFSDVSQPMGPSGDLEKMRVTENVKVPRAIESVVNDDMKAAESSSTLYDKGQDVYKITTLFSSGVLGKEESKRLVPTRWSITATDDIVFKGLAEKIRYYPEISDYMVFHSTFLDNSFTILFMPGDWEYEGMESWSPKTIWSSDIIVDSSGSKLVPELVEPYIIPEYEPFEGRTKYAEGQAGGYYATRLAIAEKLNLMRKQAKVVVFREIHEGYTVPLGVWVVRETVRNAMQSQIGKYSTKDEALDAVKQYIKIPFEKYLKHSKMLTQRRLSDFLR